MKAMDINMGTLAIMAIVILEAADLTIPSTELAPQTRQKLQMAGITTRRDIGTQLQRALNGQMKGND